MKPLIPLFSLLVALIGCGSKAIDEADCGDSDLFSDDQVLQVTLDTPSDFTP
jgi:hypothetical protein